MMILPRFPDEVSYNGKVKLTKSYLAELGFKESLDFEDEDIEEIIRICGFLRQASRARRRQVGVTFTIEIRTTY